MSSETRKRQKEIVLHSGTGFDWPVFRITPDSLYGDTSKITSFLGRKYGVMDLRTIYDYFTRMRTFNYKPPSEATQYYEFQFFESIANSVFHDFRKRPGMEEIDRQVEENTDHGYSHQRRLEKLLKEFLAKDRDYRSNPNLLFMTLSQLLSIRFHDVLELLPTGKKHHTEGGVLLTLGYLMEGSTDKLLGTKDQFDIISAENGSNAPSDDVFDKIALFTSLIELYHTQPKLLNDIREKISGKAVVKLSDLIHPEMSQQFGKAVKYFEENYGANSSIAGYVKSGQDFLKKNRRNAFFTAEEIDAVITSAKVFSGLDKLDSVLPPELSTAKTLVTMKGKSRPFYAPLLQIMVDKDGKLRQEIEQSEDFSDVVEKYNLGEELTMLDEYRVRLLLANSAYSPDDFSRMLFETQRVDFTDLPEWLMAGFLYSLELKSLFLIDAVPDIIRGKSSHEVFNNTYLTAEADMLTEFIVKHGIVKGLIPQIRQDFLALETPEERNRFIYEQVLNSLYGVNPAGLFKGLGLMRQEFEHLNKLMDKKIKELQENPAINSQTTPIKARQLLELAGELRPVINADMNDFTVPYMSYLAIT